MFLGHYGVALAAKRAAPRVSLGTCLLAAQWLDLIWPIFVLSGWERVAVAPGNTAVTPLAFLSYPLSHSLLAAAGWAAVLGGVYVLLRGRRTAAPVVAALVLSHWVLDAVVHRPDLPLYPGSSIRVGWGLWNSLLGTLLVEGLIFVAGVALYNRCTTPRDAVGKYAYRSFVIFLAIIYLGNLFGPPPPSARLVAVMGLGQWLMVAWAYWVDRHRAPVSEWPFPTHSQTTS